MPPAFELVRAGGQHTLAPAVATRGVGVHSGHPVTLRLLPAPVDHGIVFARTDLPGAPTVAADWRQVVETRLSTVLAGARGARVGTVEHLMAALRALGVDNLRVELDGPEVPILDGSAAPWVSLIDRAGLQAQAAPGRRLRVLRAVRIADGDKWAMLLPDEGERFSIEIDFADPVVGRQRMDLRLDAEGFRRAVAPARTFGFMRDIAPLQAQGLALGGSLDNAVVIGEGRVLNPEGLRFADEFVRHKLLDCVGDLYLAGAPILGRVVASRPGHALNHALLLALFASAEAALPAPALAA